MHCVAVANARYRVKLPKTFLAVNLSDAFTFQEKPQNGEGDGDADVLEMKATEHEHAATSDPSEPVGVIPTHPSLLR